MHNWDHNLYQFHLACAITVIMALDFVFDFIFSVLGTIINHARSWIVTLPLTQSALNTRNCFPWFQSVACFYARILIFRVELAFRYHCCEWPFIYNGMAGIIFSLDIVLLSLGSLRSSHWVGPCIPFIFNQLSNVTLHNCTWLCSFPCDLHTILFLCLSGSVGWYDDDL